MNIDTVTDAAQDWVRAEQMACDSEYGDAGKWLYEFLAESDHHLRTQCDDLSGPASNVELLFILFNNPTPRQQAACIMALRERYLAYADSFVQKIAIDTRPADESWKPRQDSALFQAFGFGAAFDALEKLSIQP